MPYRKLPTIGGNPPFMVIEPVADPDCADFSWPESQTAPAPADTAALQQRTTDLESKSATPVAEREQNYSENAAPRGRPAARPSPIMGNIRGLLEPNNAPVSFSVARGRAGRLLAAGTSSAAFSDNWNIRGLRLSPPPENRCTDFLWPQLSSHSASNTMTRQEATMPFGRHKDQSLRCLFDTDKQYLVWCLSQSWFRTNFGNLFDMIVEMFHRAGKRWSEE
jgi:uncharacterized protein (DUF3820 family)